jgi:glycosyltransferase involved in cell wall biosynthesis
MRILQITLGFYPAQNWGGPVKIVYQNSRELVKRGHEVTVYCTNLLNKNDKIKPGTFERTMDGIRVVYLDTINLSWWPGTLGPIWIPDLRHYLDREIQKFDILHLNGYRSSLLLTPARAARKASVPFVTQPHGCMQAIVNTLFFKHVYDRLLGRLEVDGMGALIALQETERQQALAYGIPEQKIVIIPNGIDQNELDNLPQTGAFRQKYHIEPTKKVILFLGRVNKKKGTDMLIEAFSQLDYPLAHLVIAGPDDGQLSEVKELINRYHLDSSVTITGLLTGKDVYAAFRDADLFVLPCRTDTFPTTIMESCLMGKPMIITDRCENAYLVKNRVADVVAFDAHEFADGMRSLLSDHARYQQYKENCKYILEDAFSIHRVVDQLEGVYQRVIAENRRQA